MSTPIQKGIKVLIGIPKPNQIFEGFPPGRIRFRFRVGQVARAYVKNESGITSYVLIENGGVIIPMMQGGNITLN